MENSLSPDLKTKIQTVFSSLNQGLVERDTVLKMALLTVLAGENILLIGPPGTAKSLIARRIANVLASTDNSSSYFEYLLTKFSTPDEIFGPLSIAALKADCVKRNTAGYLPTVRIAFLDEIFKASSSILNALLTILNERLYHNGAELQKVPMQALIAASNELPTGQDELSALYDRFLVRVFVDYVQLDNLPQLFAKTPEPIPFTPFSVEELAAINSAADEVIIPTQIVEAVQQIWQKHREMFKEDNREQLSDRRLKKIIKLLSVSAVTNGRTEVDLSDVLLLKDCLWNHYDNALKVREMVLGVLQGFSYEVVIEGTSQVIEKPKQTSKNVIKGYKGSGTQSDPILISTYQDIAGLERADVGQKGYYFKQTADIDCSALTTWPNIDFCGHYDGGGYKVVYKKQQNEVDSLFNCIKSESSVRNLEITEMQLAILAKNSEISSCTVTGASLLELADNCRITACLTSDIMIKKSIKQSVLSRCQAQRALVDDTAIDSTITNCFVLSYYHSKFQVLLGGRGNFEDANIVRTLNKSVIEYCLVQSRQLIPYININCENSTIQYCVLVHITNNEPKYFGKINQYTNGTCTLKRNIICLLERENSSINLDTRKHFSADSQYGECILASAYNQHYFEHTLGWDFDTVWQWNTAENRPELQSVGVGAVVDGVKKASTNSTTDDLLTQQIRANIWL